MRRAARAGATAVLAVAVTLSACGDPPSDDDDADSAQPAGASVRFRLWDDAAASAYQESFDAFNAIHRDIQVEVEVVPAASYAGRAVSDLASGTMADIFWVSSNAATDWFDLPDFLEPPATEAWEPAITELFTRDGQLWAVPQLWETSVLYVNADLLEQAGVEAASLVWDPAALAPGQEVAEEPADDMGTAVDREAAELDEDTAAEAAAATPTPTDELEDDAPADAGTADEPPPAHTDTLRDAVRSLTRDAGGRDVEHPEFDAAAVREYGFNTDLTAPPVWLAFLAQSAPGGGALVLDDDEEAAAALAYLLELPVAPASPDDVTDRELFVQGRLALFQSTSADLRYVAEHTGAEWAVVPAPDGPGGSVSVVSGIGAAANAHSPHAEATAEVLGWVASTDGQSALASHSVGIPAALGAQELFARAWSDRGLETTTLLDPAVVVTVPSGAQTVQALRSVSPVLAQLFDGELTVAEALPAAQRAADEAGGA